MENNKFYLYLLLLISIFSLAPELKADSLEEVMNSSRYKQVLDSTKDYKSVQRNKKWFNKSSNLYKLFVGGSAKLLYEWLGSNTENFVPLKKRATVEEGAVVAKGLYIAWKENYDLLVVVPHPQVYSQVDLGLFDRIADFMPPKYRALKQEELKIRGFRSLLFTHPEDGYSLMIFLSKRTVVRISSKSAFGRERIVKFADLLNLKELNKELNL